MKIIIMSDSHLHNDTVMAIIAHHKDADYYIHCGDVGKTIEQDSISHFYIVKGNNDYCDFPKELLLDIEEHRYFICHGHYYQVDNDLDLLVQKAKEVGAEFVFYGHTHHPMNTKIEGMTFVNPGSVAFPRGGQIFVPSYCVMDSNEIHFYHAKTFECIDHLFEPKKRTSLFKKFFGK